VTPRRSHRTTFTRDLDAFVSERTRLAREMRDAGDREAAEQLAVRVRNRPLRHGR
jgi:hypothetical protein